MFIEIHNAYTGSMSGIVTVPEFSGFLFCLYCKYIYIERYIYLVMGLIFSNNDISSDGILIIG